MKDQSRHVVVPELSEARLEAQWGGVRRRRAARAKRRRLGATAAVAVLGVGLTAAGAWWVGRRGTAGDVAPAPVAVVTVPPTSSTVEPASVSPTVARSATTPSTDASQTAEVTLADGSIFRAAPGARIEACDADGADRCLRVVAGSVTFEPAPDDAIFTVFAGSVRVRPHTARFVVTRKVAGSVHHVNLEVTQGEVEVFRAPGQRVALSAGESVALDEAETEASSQARPEAVRDDLDESEAPPGTSLWDRAQRARRAGQHAEAAEAYAELLREHPRDPKSGLAALELARLRMDTLDDVPGAVGPLQRALKDRRASIREDALARLVRVHDRLGQAEDCARRRGEYLDKHPQGVHTAVVERACGHD